MATEEIKSIYELIERGSELFKDKNLFKFNKGDEVVEISYNEFLDYVNKITFAFINMGVKDKKVVVIGETSVEWIASYIATVTAGGVIVPLDPYLLEDEIIKFVNHSEASFVVCSPAFEKLFRDREKDIPAVSNIIIADKMNFTLTSDKQYLSEKFTDFNNILALGEYLIKNTDIKIEKDRDTTKMSALLFTSGTTGSSKGVMLSEKNICTVVNGIYPTLWQLNTDDTLLSVLPVYHTYEMSCGILAPMIFGCSICISDGIKYVGKNIKQFSPTIMTLVPMFINQLYKNIWKSAKKQGKEKMLSFGIKLSDLLAKVHINVRKKLLSSVIEAMGGKLKYFIVGGAALDPHMVDAFASFGIQVSQGYGITECAPLISVVPLDKYNPTSCGKPMPGLSVRIDKENPEDTYGEIVVKGDNVMLGYYKDKEATDEVLDSEGWFKTGDYGYTDDEGYIYITGRKKNVIVLSGGKNLFPEELEEYLGAVPLVEEAVVVGRECKETGDITVVAVVYPNKEECDKAGLTTNEQIYEAINGAVTKINKKLASYKHIHKVELRDEPFEKTTTRKIKRYTVNK